MIRKFIMRACSQALSMNRMRRKFNRSLTYATKYGFKPMLKLT